MPRPSDNPPSSKTSAPLQGFGDIPLPVRMLNEFAYCPRLFYLMHVEGQWADNHFTVEGREVHRRVDRASGKPPTPSIDIIEGRTASTDANAHEADGTDQEDDEIAVRSLELVDEELGLSGKLDLVIFDDNVALPIETKRGHVPDNPEQSYEPERVQLMAQGLLLRRSGYRCTHGFLYFAASKARVLVPLDDALEARTLDLLSQAKGAAQKRELPAPLEDSPKCGGCSLAGICLPDETLALRKAIRDDAPASIEPDDSRGAREVTLRRLYPVRDNAQALYVHEPGAYVTKEQKRLVVKKKNEVLAEVKLKDVAHVVLLGRVTISPAAIHLLCSEGRSIAHLSFGNWLTGMTVGIGMRNAFDRAAQFRAADDPVRCLGFARRIVSAKIRNQRTLLRRNGSDVEKAHLDEMTRMLRKAEVAKSLEQLLGFEGNAARLYFSRFDRMLRARDLDTHWDFEGRNRRPPRDPVNAMLSFAYALLVKEVTSALYAEGLDPWWGLYHQPRHGKPALALDLMEEFRPIIADSAVVTAVNTGMVGRSDFTRHALGCILTPPGRKALIRAYETRLDQVVTHPIFGYRCSWRSILRVQAKLLTRWLRGDIPDYIGMVTR